MGTWTKLYEDCDHETLVLACKNLYREGEEARAKLAKCISELELYVANPNLDKVKYCDNCETPDYDLSMFSSNGECVECLVGDNNRLKRGLADIEEAFLAEQQACVDALSRLDDAEDDLKKCSEEIGRLMGVINHALAWLGMGNSVRCHDELMKELKEWKAEQAKAER